MLDARLEAGSDRNQRCYCAHRPFVLAPGSAPGATDPFDTDPGRLRRAPGPTGGDRHRPPQGDPPALSEASRAPGSRLRAGTPRTRRGRSQEDGRSTVYPRDRSAGPGSVPEDPPRRILHLRPGTSRPSGGTPFPGGDRVAVSDGVYFYPFRKKTHDFAPGSARPCRPRRPDTSSCRRRRASTGDGGSPGTPASILTSTGDPLRRPSPSTRHSCTPSGYPLTITNWSFPAPHSGQTQSSGSASNATRGELRPSGLRSPGRRHSRRRYIRTEPSGLSFYCSAFADQWWPHPSFSPCSSPCPGALTTDW